MRNIYVFIFAVIAAVASFLLWTGRTSDVPLPSETSGKKLSIVATFYPLEAFARAVGGDAVTVASIVPAGVEPHDYEPTIENILSTYQADIFLLNGAGVDAWAEKIRPDLERRGIAVVQMSDIVSLSDDAEPLADPHFWLDPILAKQEVASIRDILVSRDPQQRVTYTENAARFSRELDILDAAYRSGLADCRLHTIVTSHDAFAYLAKRYGFTALAVSGMSPEAEPSPRTLAEIANTARTQGVRYIFFETLVSPKVAQTLAQAVGAQTLVFNPLEGLTDEDRQAGADYLSVMRDNLDNVRTALECHL
ncbi:MAG: hypothetical protein A3E38_03140 [Candidatus Moranbacteria bacterium RIFCSPHIGHO2_12_FULL_54_9]|nr:MAG: hypothetical protein A3E38_03140 [Candidatus Moranbacteria bacterium RIFCSPHIGHO2_12_FULL_54_9]